MRKYFLLFLFFPISLFAQWKAFPPEAGAFQWRKSGQPVKTDSIRFIQGSGATLTQTNNTLSIAATGTGTTIDEAQDSTGWIRNGTLTRLNPTTNNVAVGVSNLNSKFAIDADSDEIQGTVQGHSTQTNDIFVVEKSDGTDLLSVTNSGLSKLNTTDKLDLTGAVSGDIIMRRSSPYWVDTTASFSSAGGWTDGGTLITLTTTSDRVSMGQAGDLGAKLNINGDANIVQEYIQANSTQSVDCFYVESNAGTAFFRVTGSGNVGIGTGQSTYNKALSVDTENGAQSEDMVVAKFVHSTNAGSGVIAGMGTSIDYQTEVPAGQFPIGTNLQSVCTVGTSSAQSFDFVIKNMSAGAAAAEKFRVTSAGNANITKDVVFSAGTLDASSVMGGLNIFSGSAQVDTVLVSGAASTDMYFITFRTALDATTTSYFVEAKNDTFIVHLVGANISTPEYNWLRVKQ